MRGTYRSYAFSREARPRAVAGEVGVVRMNDVVRVAAAADVLARKSFLLIGV